MQNEAPPDDEPDDGLCRFPTCEKKRLLNWYYCAEHLRMNMPA